MTGNPNYESELLEIVTIIEMVNMLHNYPCKLTDGVGYNAIATLFLSNESYIACASRMQLYIYSGLHKWKLSISLMTVQSST